MQIQSSHAARTIRRALQKTVHIYEEKFGEIDLARIQAGGKSTS